jgi:hypothetical protein
MSEENTKYIDYLDEDQPLTGQSWVCISFVSPEGIKNCTVRGLKVRGVYATRKEADERADELSKIDPDFDVFVGEVGKWLPWDPDPNSVEDQQYQEKELNELMKGHKDNLAKSQRMQAQRKKDMIKQAANQERDKKSKVKARLRKKLADKNSKKNSEGLETNNLNDEFKRREESLKEQENLANNERERLVDNEKKINEASSNISSIDQQLEKIQSLYKKMNDKEKSSSS